MYWIKGKWTEEELTQKCMTFALIVIVN